MLTKHTIGLMSSMLMRLAAAIGSTRALALVSALTIVFILSGTAHRARHDQSRGFAHSDALDMRALGLGTLRRTGPSRFASAEPSNLSREPLLKPAPRLLPVLDTEQQNIARFIASRYRVTLSQTQFFVENAYRTARELRVDPWLILAVISVESSFNPRAQSHKGAQGLMQVLTRVHVDKFEAFGGVAAAFDPVANIKVGARILHEYLARAGSVEGALKFYVGAAALPHDGGYAAKVLRERALIAEAAGGNLNRATARVQAAVPARQATATGKSGSI